MPSLCALLGNEEITVPGILSIPDTVSVRGSVWGNNLGGSRVSRDT